MVSYFLPDINYQDRRKNKQATLHFNSAIVNKKLLVKQTNINRFLTAMYAASFFVFILSCSKGGDSGGGNTNPCTGITVIVSATPSSPTTAGGADGSISVTATGGSGFTYSLNNGTFQPSGNFTGLATGTYTVTAKSSAGCTGTASVTISAPNLCSGVTINVTATTTNPATGGGNNGSIVVTATGGSSSFTYSLNGGAFQSSATFSGLTAGLYNVIAKNAEGCQGSANFTLTDPCTGVTINVTGTVVHPSTFGGTNGSISATASGGTGFTYNINGGAYQASGVFTGLSAGTYTVGAKSSAGCTGSASFTLTNPNPCSGVVITVTNTVTNNTPCLASPNGSISASASGGTGSYMYSLNSGTFQSSNLFSGIGAGSYTITARDANNCNGSGTATVVNLSAGPLFTQVRSVLQANCVSCHNNTIANGGMNWEVDCNIVNNRDRIRARAVDGNPSAMPPTGLISAAERQKITDWINAGGRFTD